MKTIPRFFPAALVTVFVLSQASSQATLLLSEHFSYGIADSTTINGVASTASGTTGNWAVTNIGGAGNTTVFTTTGLTFGSTYITTGGALQQQSTYNGPSSDNTLAKVQLNTSASGTVWASYLANYTQTDLRASGFGEVGVSQDAGANTHFSSRVISNTSAASRTLGVAYDTGVSTTTTAFATGTTYMFISKFTNVGTALGGVSGVATTWVLTSAQYDALFTAGFSEASLDTGGAYFQKNSDTAATGTYNFNSSGYLTLRSNAPDYASNKVIVVFDEIKFGTGIADVTTPIPEPSTYAIIAGAVGLVTVRRRRSLSA